MKTWLQKFNLESALFILAVLLGAVLRLVELGLPALTEGEARLALQSLDILHRQPAFQSPEPGYILLTSLMFFIFNASDFTARLWPAITGTLLITAAWLVRDFIGRKPALILAFLIALDPVLVAASRTASGQSGAIACLLLGFILLLRGFAGWSGAFVGLSLLGGPTVWPGAISIGMVCWLFRGRSSEFGLEDLKVDWRKFAFVGVVVFGLAGTLFFMVPVGLSAAAGSLVAYVKGWITPGTVSISRLLAVILAYQIPVVLFALVGLVWGVRAKNPIDQALSVWWGIALVLTLVYPSRSVQDAVLTAFPMLALSARQAARLGNPQPEDRLPVFGQAALTVVLILYLVYTLLFTQVSAGSPVPTETLLKLGMALLLLFAITGMVAWGWSLRIATTGLQWGATFLLIIFAISAVFHATGLSRNPEAELVNPSPYVASADLLALSLNETIQWRPIPIIAPNITVIGVNSSALRWSLRDYPQTFFTNQPVADLMPDIVISEESFTPELAAEYRGQSITWTKTPAWSLLAPGEWLRWLMYREVPVEGMEHQQILYWVKADEFPGGGTLDTPVSVPEAPADGESDSNSQ